MNAQEAIAQVNESRLLAPNMLELLTIIADAANREGDEQAHNFLWLCHWRPQQLPN